MIAEVIDAAEEKALLEEWFETVQFDHPSTGIPDLAPERDDEESRALQDAIALTEWFKRSDGEAPPVVDSATWTHPKFDSNGMNLQAARAYYEKEASFHQLFMRVNTNHDKLGKFAAGGHGGIGGGASISNRKADDLSERVQKPDGGFTVDPRTGKDVKSGYAVAIYPDRSKEIPHSAVGRDTIQKYADDNKDLLITEGNMMGGWHDPDSGSVWLDISRVTSDKREAIDLAKQHNQIAIFDLGSGNSINTGGTGRSSYPFVFTRANPYHSKKDGKFASKNGGVGASAESVMPPTEEPKVIDRYVAGMKDPVSGNFYSANSGAPWQNETDLEMRAGGLWSDTYDGMAVTRQVINNRNNGKPDMEGVNPERGWLSSKYQRVGEVQYGNNGPRLGEVIRKGDMYSKEDMGVDIRNAATVLQHKMDIAPSHSSPLYRGMLMNRKDLPKAGDTFSNDISSWAKTRQTAEVFAYAREAPSLGIIGDHAVVMRMVGKKKSADIGNIVASGVMRDEHLAKGTFKVNRVTRKGKSVNIEVEQVHD